MKKALGPTKEKTVKQMYEDMSPKNKKYLDDFLAYKEGYVSSCAVESYWYRLIRVIDLLEKDLDKATKEDMTKIGGLILQSPFTDKTKEDFIASIKNAFKFWFGENEYFPKQVLGLKRPKTRTSLKLPQDMLTEEQIHQMIRGCTNYRDKFYVALSGLDGALRPCEARNIKWGDVKKDKYGHFITIYTAKKSGNKETRTIRIIKSEPYFIQWNQNYPIEKRDDAYVFINFSRLDKMGEGAIRSLFKRLKRKLGYNGRLYPYLLRHSCITRMSKDPRIPIPVLKKFVGHSLRSNSIAEYQHFGDDDLKDMQLEINGIKKAEEDKPKECLPVKCTKCEKMNEFDAEFCYFCNQALTQKRMIEGSETLNTMNKQMESMQKRQEMLLLELRKLRKKEPEVIKLEAQ